MWRPGRKHLARKASAAGSDRYTPRNSAAAATPAAVRARPRRPRPPPVRAAAEENPSAQRGITAPPRAVRVSRSTAACAQIPESGGCRRLQI